MAAEPDGGEPDLDALSFEELVDRLEALTAQLADGGIGIERAADLYERAQRLHAAASARLEAVARRIESL
jgi:exodeoxyribonuclease VII small subunit